MSNDINLRKAQRAEDVWYKNPNCIHGEESSFVQGYLVALADIEGAQVEQPTLPLTDAQIDAILNTQLPGYIGPIINHYGDWGVEFDRTIIRALLSAAPPAPAQPVDPIIESVKGT